MFKYLLSKTLKLITVQEHQGWISDLCAKAITSFQICLISKPLDTRFIEQSELLCFLFAYNAKHLSRYERESWAVQITSTVGANLRILQRRKEGAKFHVVVQTLCDAGTRFGFHRNAIRYALRDMRNEALKQSSLNVDEYMEGIESAHVINNLGVPIWSHSL